MLFATKKVNKRRFTVLLALFVAFALVYMVACDDEVDFGGISVMHDAMRDFIGRNVAASELQKVDVRVEAMTAREDPRVRKRAKVAQVARDAADGVQEDTRYVKYSWKRALDMLYFSISNTVTLGYGDIYPISPKSKLLVIGQILAVFAVLCVK